MKKFIIGSFVSAVILFVWSSLSWTVLPIHTCSFHYTPKQDSIMKVLNGSGMESGEYMLPTVDNRPGHPVGMMNENYRKEVEELRKSSEGKSFAMLIYNKEGAHMDPMQFVRGFLIDLLSAMFVVILLAMSKDKLTTFFMRWWAVLLIGFVVVFNSYLLEWNWLMFPWHFIKGEIIDTVVEWGLIGLWLAWYIKPAKA